MSRHVVRFIKRLCDDTGHPHSCTQAIIEIRSARTCDRAIAAARFRFARVRRIDCWDTHADSFEIDPRPEVRLLGKS